MRAAVIAPFVAVVTALACGTTDTEGEDEIAPGSGTKVTASYCKKYCDAQASAGTLRGTRAGCLAECCKDVEGGCDALDASSEDEDGEIDAGVDADPACARPCGNDCCTGDTACGRDGNGALACVETCTTPDDCATGCCAPATNEAGEPVGPYVCKPNDGKAYDCCFGVTTCANPTCCVADTNGNKFCAAQCSSNAQCGGANCVAYTFSLLNTTCWGPTACGP